MRVAASIWSPSYWWSPFCFKWQNSLTNLYHNVHRKQDFIVNSGQSPETDEKPLAGSCVFQLKSLNISNGKCLAAWEFFPWHYLAWFCVVAQWWFHTHWLNIALLRILNVLKWLTAQWTGSDCLVFVCLFWLDSFYKAGACGCCSVVALCKDTEKPRLKMGLVSTFKTTVFDHVLY